MSETDPVPTDELLVEIARLARRYAEEIVGPDIAEDLAHEVVLELLPRVRDGTIARRPAELGPLIREVVRRRAVDWLRRAQRRAHRNAQHARDVEEFVRAWMSPEVALEEEHLTALHQRILDALPPRCRRVYTMVREECSTYKVVADQLGVTENAVRLHVVRAQHRLRIALYEEGVMEASEATGPGRRGRRKKQSKHDLHTKPRGAR